MVWSVAALDLDLLTYWMLNVSSAFMLSAANNVLFFVLDWRMPVLNFLHNAVPALFLLVRLALSPDRRPLVPRLLCAIVRAPLRSLLWRLVAAQLFVSAFSARVYVHNRAGALYLCRIFDFLGTFLIICFGANFLNNANIAGGNKEETQRRRGRVAIWALLVTDSHISIAFNSDPCATRLSSVAWPIAFRLAGPGYRSTCVLRVIFMARIWQHRVGPVGSVFGPAARTCPSCSHSVAEAGAVGIFAALGMPNGKNGCECCEHGTHPHHRPRVALPDETFEWFALCYLVAVGTLLAPTALHSYANSVVPYDASWESIDYLLMGMSVVFMSGFKYSELWLISRLEPHQFCALEHSKYFMASIGQWFLQNMAHATVFAAVGKALFVVSALRYWLRADEMDAVGGARAKEKCGPKNSFAG
ncbi:hypothetical protein niasHT_034021 [Heterodera trifolii]|uniref:Uncharacterized protein n=1 Tax=Heterodera trifolii TaxID=157864 RepID=A0ABD2I1H4_9BILA